MNSEEKTSPLQPGTINHHGVERLRKLAKRIQKERSCKRAEALELVAQQHGFKNWNNVLRFASKRPISSGKRLINQLLDCNMFIEIKASDNTLTDWTLDRYDFSYLEPLTKNRSINLTKVDCISYTRVVLEDKYYSEEDGPESHRAILFEYIFDENIDRFIFVFTDEGEFHRAKRQIEDLLTNSSKK